MSILTAMNQKSLLAAALAYHAAGISVVPVKGKAATVRWADYQSRRPTRGELLTWFSRRSVTGLAIISGAVSRNLCIVDLDGVAAARAFGDTFPWLRQTLVVASANGWHCYYHVDQLPDTTRLVNCGDIKEIGLRAGGHYTVAPPSLHPSGVSYMAVRRLEPLRVGSLGALVDWIDSQRDTPIYGVSPAVPTPISGGENDAYVNAVLRRELDHVRNAPEGTRNDSLFHASRRLAMLCANPASGLSESNVRTMLENAAARLARDDGHKTIVATIESGWRRGCNEPRPIPEVTNG